MKMCRKYPVSLEEYRDMHMLEHAGVFVEARYVKAKYVYSCLKYPRENGYQTFYSNTFGKLTKPEDAFKIWWDI